MKNGEIIAIIISVLVITAAIGYIIWSKRRGKGCIGCPDSHNCAGKHAGSYACKGSCNTCSVCRDKASNPDKQESYNPSEVGDDINNN